MRKEKDINPGFSRLVARGKGIPTPTERRKERLFLDLIQKGKRVTVSVQEVCAYTWV